MVITSTSAQLFASNVQAVAEVSSLVKRSTTNPFGDIRPMDAIQSGKTSSGKKLPPIISNGKSKIDVNRLAAFCVGNSICNAANQANRPTPEIVTQTRDGTNLPQARPW